jgi:hypothetical protein
MQPCDILAIHKVTNFLTGSRAWDVHTNSSDMDICVLACEYDRVEEVLKNSYDISEITDASYNNGKYFSTGYTTQIPNLNIIRLSVPLFLSWHFATNSMYVLDKNKIRDRHSRITTFSLLELAARNMIDMSADYHQNGRDNAQDIATKEIIRRHLKTLDKANTNIVVANKNW